jgi:N-acetylneuraminate synthase
MNPVFLIAEIGINHNGCLETAKKLIKEAKDAGFDAVKFQKRTIDLVYSPEELDKTRESPWGTTNREQKEGLEFKQEDYDAIDEYCKELGIQWSASAWDLKSQEFLRQYDLPFNKVASAMLTCKPLLEKIAEEKKLTYISTGMSTYQEIEDAREIFINTSCPYILMHCNSSYPTENGNCRLNFIREFQNRFHCSVGYSGHERGVQISVAAVAMGARAIERHITLDRTMYGL